MPRYNVTVSQALRSEAVISMHAEDATQAERGATQHYTAGRAQLITKVDPVGDVSARAVEVEPHRNMQSLIPVTVVWRFDGDADITHADVTQELLDGNTDAFITHIAAQEYENLTPEDYEESTLEEYIAMLVSNGYDIFSVIRGHQEQLM